MSDNIFVENQELDVEFAGTNIMSNDYNTLRNKPQINGHTLSGNLSTSDLGIDIPTKLSELTDDSTHRLVTDSEKTAWNGKSDFSGDYNDLTNKPSIPDELSDLSDDSTHRLVTDTEKSTWNGKANTSDIPTKTSDLNNDSGFIGYTDVIGTLAAGATSLTLQSEAITTTSTLEYFTDVFGVSPSASEVTAGQIVLTFEAQASAINVKVRVS